MPVTGLYYIQEATQTPAAHLLTERLAKRHQPLPIGRWSFEHRLLRETPPPPPTSSTSPTSPTPPLPVAHKFMQWLDLSYYQAASGGAGGAGGGGAAVGAAAAATTTTTTGAAGGSLFVLADKTIVTVSREFELIVRSKMMSMWTQRQTLKAEGWMYEVEDFKIRIANLSQGDQVKGVVVEIEYTPMSNLEEGEGIMRDFLAGLDPPPGKFVFAPKEGYVPGQEWTILDTGRQYCELLRFR